jgi:enoyl-CoA hydratase
VTKLAERKFDALLLEEPAPDLLVVRINRPEVANAFNTQLGRELLEVFSALGAEPDLYRCAILTAAGERHFCAGGDLKERDGMSDAEWQAQHLIFERMALAMVDCPIPVIAAVNGVAFAGGCELILNCDFVYAAKNARFALTETRIGIIPGTGGTQNLPRALGVRRAKELIYAARPFSAEEAFAWGLVNKLCEPGQLLQEALATASEIVANAPLAIRQAKRSIDYGQRMDLRSALFFEVEAYNRLVPTEDRREGVRAFNEKRKPVFKGR